MVAVKVILVKLSSSQYSIKVLGTYQVAATYPLAPPSTLVGSLARSLNLLGLCGSGAGSWKDEVNDCINKVRSMMWKIRDSSALAQDGHALASKYPVTIRVLRGVLEEGRMPGSKDEFVKFMDAMVREFIISHPRFIIIVPRSDDYVKDLAKASWLIGRLGNSESYVSVSSVEVFETRDCDVDEVNVVVKFNPSYIVGGSYIVNKAVDEDGNEELLAFPVSSYQRGDVYYPSRVKVKDRVYCVDDKVFIPKGDWW